MALTDNNLLYYPFDEGSGTTVIDASGNDNGATLPSANLRTSEAKVGAGALEFNGTDEQFNTGFAPFASGNVPSFTIGMWVYVEEGANQYARIVSYKIDSNNGFVVSLDTGTKRIFLRLQKTGTVHEFSHANNLLSLNQYNFVVFTFDTSDNTATIRINDTTPTVLKTSGGGVAGATTLYLGSTVGSQYYKGRIDEFFYYSRIISSAEQTELYNDGDGFNPYASVGPTAPTVTTQAVTDIAKTTATGNGNVTADGGETITERGVVWSTTTTPTTADSKATSAGTTGAFTASMTGLTADTLYYVRAYAINSEGTSYGDEVTFTTLEGDTAPALTTGAATVVRATLATANGEVTADGGQPVTERGFVWATTTAPDVADNKVEVTGTTGAYSVGLTGLPAETLVYLRAYAINSVGTSYGNEVSFTTLALSAVKNPMYRNDGGVLKRIN